MKLSELKSGMMFRSKTHHHADMSIYVCDEYCICWTCINRDAFDRYVSKKKGVKNIQELLDNGKNTFPYPYAGECNLKSFNQRLKKYNLELVCK